ncbi:MAG: hypothetical protein HKN41_00180 [Ilumatobacter sp.]|nr:hypothetical protein [Ilumatobacter sp.]
MLVLIATDQLTTAPSGPHAADRHHAVDGELVTPVVLDCPDAGCEVCARAWFGLVSHGGTTTAMVVDRPGVTEAALRERIHDWLDCAGTIDLIVQASEAGEYEVDGVCVDDPVAAVDELVSAHVDEIRAICARFPVGTVVSRLGQLVAPRHLDAAA